MMSRTVAVPIIACLAAFTPLGAQQAPRLRLKPASATHPEEFSGIARVRELADGRVIALDSAERKLYLVDFKSGSAPQLGRVGDGPEEYRWPNGLHALPGDSTLVTDAQTGRLVIFHQARPVATTPADAPVMKRGGFIFGAGAGGYLVRGFLPTDLGRATDQGDSLYLARYARRDGRGDTLTRMRSGSGGPPGSATKATPTAGYEDTPPTRRVSMMSPRIGDQAIGFADGWIAVVRVEPYRVDWITPDGKLQRGAPINVLPAPLTDKEKRFYLARVAAMDGLPAGQPADITDWKPTIPPFWGSNGASLRQTAEGHLLIERAPTSALPTPTYDLVDRSGTHRGQLVLRASEAVVGFGAKSIYLVARNADGTEQLQRHPWP
jgi:hypothetical protein